MRVLLDTHALLWWLENDPQLTSPAAAAIADPEARPLVSIATAWECAIKVQSGKLPQAAALVANFRRIVDAQGFGLLGIALDHALLAGALPRYHGDPFDRMLIAQTLIEGVLIVSNEEEFDAYGVKRIW
jgi:PIN domain nuclease of toxin-antitoxin system